MTYQLPYAHLASEDEKWRMRRWRSSSRCEDCESSVACSGSLLSCDAICSASSSDASLLALMESTLELMDTLRFRGDSARGAESRGEACCKLYCC